MTKEERKTKGKPDPVDIHVGQRLRVRRSLLGMSQEKLGKSIDITFQQIQKYEQGMNRISAGRLYKISKILQVPITYFFDNVPSNDSVKGYALSDNDQEGFIDDRIMQDKETLELVRAFASIKDPEVRKSALRLLKSIATDQ